MKVKQLLKQLNKLAEANPKALEMEVFALNQDDEIYDMSRAQINRVAFNVGNKEKYGTLVGDSCEKRLKMDWDHIKNVVTIDF